MRIGIVVDSACDLPWSFIERNRIEILPISVKIGNVVLADHRNEQATLQFLDSQVAARSAEAETMPYSVGQIRDVFLRKLVIDYDYVFCLTITKTRSPIHDNARQASFVILNDYKPIRVAAGHATPFALRVIDSQSLFAGQGVGAVEAVRMIAAEESVANIRARLDRLALDTHAYMVPRDLLYLRSRAKTKGDKSVSLVSATLGTAMDIKPVLHCSRGETGPVAKIRGFDTAVRRLFQFAVERVRAGLSTPTLCMSYGGELDEMRKLPGYNSLVDVCRETGVEVFESVMSLTGMVNVGKGALTLGFAAGPHEFKA
ncbi:MAG: DegV family EDD domain-containing protein [Lysobacteraceae bacterium]|nr:MAG: DegV family EDD domain-containing protein [Xanthomonadaceae bacterium]